MSSIEPMEPFFKEIKEPKELAMTGNYAVAGGVTQTDPDIVCAFPITPQTQSVEGLSDVVYHGRLKTAFVNVESELAAMSFSTGACASGARTFTATASQGYMLMMEALPMAVGWRVPLTMLISARAFNAPNLSIWNAWEFTLADIGWNVIVAENVQETYDNAIISLMIAEKTLFPTMFVHDGFIISHAVHKFMALADEQVRKLTPQLDRHTITPEKPGLWGSLVTPEQLMEQRLAIDLDKKKVPPKIDEAFKEFEKETGRKYEQIETYKCEGAKTAIITMGSVCGNIISWQKKNPDVGLIKLKIYRPFPLLELRKLIEDFGIEKIAVLEKFDAPGAPIAQLGASVIPAIYPLGIPIKDFIAGYGGRDVTRDEFNLIKKKMEKLTGIPDQLYQFIGVREKSDKMWSPDPMEVPK
ncbi:MAG: pyruvate ferredoxin oxidoreductase [Candidatus Lokiarchaeota archaeon]|nr:pyruvate ferredoxin oxidoreductase [Candidatus Lokiarchaeota archaeon]MBD3341722.1 pyruvate ferredoxin oxidoreductase [Candidatus Lokiarchaeota archaeon]